METGTWRGRLVFTFAVGVIVVAGTCLFGARLTPSAPPPTPTPTPTPTPRAAPTAPTANALRAALDSRSPDTNVTVGTTTRITISFRNTGTATWVLGTPSELRLGVKDDDQTFPRNGMTVNWLAPTRMAAQSEASVGPGQIASFAFEVRGVNAGTFRLPVRPLVEGVAWLEDPSVTIVVTVVPRQT